MHTVGAEEENKRSRAYHFCSPSKLFKRQRILLVEENGRAKEAETHLSSLWIIISFTALAIRPSQIDSIRFASSPKPACQMHIHIALNSVGTCLVAFLLSDSAQTKDAKEALEDEEQSNPSAQSGQRSGNKRSDCS